MIKIEGHVPFSSHPFSSHASRLLAELGADRDVFDTAEALQCYAGAAPVTEKSGRSRRVKFRRACNMTLRATIHLWADRSRIKSTWAQASYLQKRTQGKGHATALRCLALRWLKILWKMWQECAQYDSERHLRDQTHHGSWVISLVPQPTVQSN